MQEHTLTTIIDQGIKAIDRRRKEIASLKSQHRQICEELKKAIAERSTEVNRIGGLTLTTKGDVAEVVLLTSLDKRNATYTLTLTPDTKRTEIAICFVTPDGNATTPDYRSAGELLNENAAGELVDRFIAWCLESIIATMN